MFPRAGRASPERRWHEPYRDVTGDQVWAQIERGAGTRLDYHAFEHGTCAATGSRTVWCGDR